MSCEAPFSRAHDGISVIIPTHARIALLNRAVKKVREQCNNIGVPHEIVVVADGDHEAYVECLQYKHKQSSHVEPVLIPHDGFRPSLYRNLGAAHAKYDRLVFLDDDCRPHSNWLHGYESALEAGKVCFGPIRYPPNGRDPRGEEPKEIGEHVWTGNFAVMREDFWRIGGMDPHFDEPGERGEGAEFGIRAEAAGLDICFVDTAKVGHETPQDSEESQRLQNEESSRALYFRERREELVQ